MGTNTLNWTWKSFDRLEMVSRGWAPAGNPKAAIVLVHGLGEHCERYAHVGAKLAESGYALLGFDLRGHGRSGGPRGHAPSFESFLKDIDEMLAQASARYPSVRQFIYGHSLGGVMVLNYVLRRKPALAGAVVTSAALRTALEDQKAKVAAVKMLGSLLPSASVASGLDAAMLSRDHAVVDRYKQDPLVHDRVSFGMGKGVLSASQWAIDHAGEFSIPLLIMHGTEDRIAFDRGTREFAAKLKQDVTLKLWEGMYHETHNEPDKEQVFAFLLAWLDDHLKG
ncbi:MAG: lysophospholipase [Gemmatimonadales bacterium]|jgi:alpha-beta hydrolase superfamily lysophospholipase